MDRSQEPKPNLKATRYTDDEFPPYRFIPGINPHPTRSPEGHSYDQIETLDKAIPVDENHSNYLYGIDLYNHAYWWESHEAWEDIWHLVDKQAHVGQLLQGLIQVSAAFIKWYVNEPDGSSRLYNIGSGRLRSVANFSPVFMNLNIDAHLEKLDAHFRTFLETGDTSLDPFENYPYIILEA